jgi:glycosyltransferase involved in cell wall biosynthesis
MTELAPRLVERGHEVIVYNRSVLFHEKPPAYRGVRLIYLPSIETKVLGTPTHTLVSLIDVLFRKVDVIFVIQIVNGMHCIIPRIFGKKFAINVDGLDWKRGKWGRVARGYFHMCARLIGKICPDGVVTDAKEMQRIYAEEFHTPSVAIAYGANIESAENPEVVRQYGLEPNQYYLVASRFVPENHADLIVKAFEKVQTNRLLAIAGDTNYRSKFVEQVKSTRDPRIKFLGHVANAAHVKELHCNAYGYIHGHSVGGTNPALLKALGYGNCVLALDVPFNREVVADAGLLFPRDVEGLRAVLQHIDQHPELAEQYRRRAPQRIREAYTWEGVTDAYERLFYRLATGKVPESLRAVAEKEFVSSASK